MILTSFTLNTRNTQTLLKTVNEELGCIRHLFRANQFSLNIKRTKLTFFHKSYIRDNIPLKLPQLNISNEQIRKANSIKFLGVSLDENINWKVDIRLIKNKIAKKHWVIISCRKLSSLIS